MKKFILTLLVIIIQSLMVNVFAQEQIDVKSITISQDAIGNTNITISANNIANQEINYNGSSISQFNTPLTPFYCSPCDIPTSFSSTGFGELGFRANIGVDRQIIVTFSAPATSDQIVLRPTIQRKKRTISVKGNTLFSIAKIEITNAINSSVIDAIDNDVILNGNFEANFWINNTDFSRRKAGFQRITFNFDEPRN